MAEGGPYSDREVALIIERLFRQHSSRSESQEDGLSLVELEQLAGELGVPADQVRAAAEEVAALQAVAEGALAPPHKHLHAVRWLPGRRSDVEIEELFAELKTRFAPEAPGWFARTEALQRMGKTWEWRHASMRITLTDRDDGYLLQVFSSPVFDGTTSEAILLSLWAAVAVGGVIGGGVGEAYGFVWFAVILAAACALSFAVVPRTIRRTREKAMCRVERVADEAARIFAGDRGAPVNLGAESEGRVRSSVPQPLEGSGVHPLSDEPMPTDEPVSRSTRQRV